MAAQAARICSRIVTGDGTGVSRNRPSAACFSGGWLLSARLAKTMEAEYAQMELPPVPQAESHGARLARYGAVSTALALLGDRRLGTLLDRAPSLGTGIGGTAVRLTVEHAPVFVKRVPLTELELRPEHLRSTANLFRLPPFCQYGVGSPSFGAWRELAANTMTTNWVLTGHCASFPLMYHWRILPGTTPVPEEHADMERTVAYWAGSPAVRERLEALAGSSASLVLFLEYAPHNLHDWLTGQFAAGGDALASACAMVERSLRAEVPFMTAHGLFHFDAHFRNILTDGQRLYFADLGLATSPRFELSTPEAEFLATNSSHEECYAVTQLVNWLVTALARTAGPAARNDFIREYAEGGEPAGLPAWAAATVRRYAPVAVVMNDFYWQLHGESRTTPYPAAEIAQACAAAGFHPVPAAG